MTGTYVGTTVSHEPTSEMDLFVPKHPGDVALLLRDKRRHEDHRQADLAEALGVTQSVVSDWEGGADLQLSNVMTWANALGYRIALLQFENAPDPTD